jgi:Leucine-rich repeat (LRR) protein
MYRLRQLVLDQLQLNEGHLFSWWMASLPRLEVLQMKGNLFTTVPSSLRANQQLQVLNLANNPPLQLSDQSVGVLCDLPCLKKFVMGKKLPLQGSPSNLVWTGETLRAVLALKARKSNLDNHVD